MIGRLVILRIMNKILHKIIIKIILNKKIIKIISLITQNRKLKNKNLNFPLDLIQIHRIKNMILFIQILTQINNKINNRYSKIKLIIKNKFNKNHNKIKYIKIICFKIVYILIIVINKMTAVLLILAILIKQFPMIYKYNKKKIQLRKKMNPKLSKKNNKKRKKN